MFGYLRTRGQNGYRWLRTKITAQRSVKASLAVAGVGAVGVGLAALAFPAALPILATAKVGELIVAGSTLLATSASLTKPMEPSALAATSASAGPPHFEHHLEIEKIRDVWRRYALDAGLALLAYLAIAIPVGFLVLSISDELPISSMVIVACYAYVGLTKFLGFDEFSVIFRRERGLTIAPSATDGSEPITTTPV
jgi:hypothetical protein